MNNSDSGANVPEIIQRSSSDELDAILGKSFPVLDKGFIRVVDYAGNEASIVRAARVSYGKGTKTVREDKGLIRYLLRKRHTSPFEQANITFHCKIPVLVARQWVRHRTARLNEVSGRYSIISDEFYVPDPERIQLQSKDNKQGSDLNSVISPELRQELHDLIVSGQEKAYLDYLHLLYLGKGVPEEREADSVDTMAKELARINMPLSLYTEWYWQIDLHNLMHFLTLRMDSHAQYEIRCYADEMYKVLKLWVPNVISAFDDFVYGVVTFTGPEQKLIRMMQKEQPKEWHWYIYNQCSNGKNDPIIKKWAKRLGISSGELIEIRPKLERMLYSEG